MLFTMRSLRFLFIFLLSSSSTLLGLPAQAQINPDQTLGTEASIVTPNVEVRGELADLIEGGAARGLNLFHSFSDFNVLEDERIYFANPDGIESILSRVTGNDLSNIFGTLGVDGGADLFLINPNGIVFGSEVNLDVEGSLYATTAEAVSLGEGVFSATSPEQSQLLLLVKPDTSFFHYLTADSGDIVNRGQLAVGRDVALAANNLDLQGQVAAGGSLSLLATDTVQIRDTTETPFIAFAGGDLLVQGNQQVDIVALNHSESGLFSYDDMVLRSAERVHGDAHYWSGGNFQIEQLNGLNGSLYSPHDPVIVSRGDVSLDAYLGASLHIFAGGSVTIPSRIQVISADPFFGFSEDIVLTDGTLISIRGANEPTIDIRAGIDPSLLFGESVSSFGNGQFVPATFPNSGLTNSPTGSDITIGAIEFRNNGAAIGGQVLLTNQYRPNTELINGNIHLTGSPSAPNGVVIAAANQNGNGGNIFIDSRGDVQVDGLITASATISEMSGTGGNGGNIRLIAQDDIIFTPSIINTPLGLFNLSIQSTGMLGGAVTLQAGDQISFERSGIFSNSFSNLPGKGGTILLDANSIALADNSTFSAGSQGNANAGNIVINADENLQVSSGSRILSETPLSDTIGKSGNISIDVGSLSMDRGIISSITGNRGSAGQIDIDADLVQLRDNSIIRNFVGANSSSTSDGIFISSINMSVNNSVVASGLNGTGRAGDINLNISEDLSVLGLNGAISASVDNGGNGIGGNINIFGGNVSVLEGASIRSSIEGVDKEKPINNGTAGNINVDLEGQLSIAGLRSGIFTSVGFRSMGNSGSITVDVDGLSIESGSQIAASHVGVGLGRAGDITIQADDAIILRGRLTAVQSLIAPSVQGQSGDIHVAASLLLLEGGAGITTSSTGVGNAGDIEALIRGDVLISGASAFGGSSGITSNVSPLPNTSSFGIIPGFELPEFFSSPDNTAIGDAGSITLKASNVVLENGGVISNAVGGQGDSQAITLDIENRLTVQGFSERLPSGIYTQVDSSGIGNAGPIFINAEHIIVRNVGIISSSNSGNGNAGNISIRNVDTLTLDSNGFTNLPNGNEIVTFSERGSGGEIYIDARQIRLAGDSDIRTNVNSGGGSSGNIIVASGSIVALDDSDILAFSADGRGGNITLDTPAFFGENYSANSSSLLEDNNRVDINATGRLASGSVAIPDVSFVENNLTELTDNLVNPDSIVANSCIARSDNAASTFTLTGSDRLPQAPTESTATLYPSGTVQPIPSPTAFEPTFITEPQAIYQLSDGRLVMSRNCEQQEVLSSASS
jgi:filamentous hemagglutinin family protein